MKYIECPGTYRGKKPSLFLGGGITKCRDWQQEITEMLRPTDLVILNPRRKSFDATNKYMAKDQIKWEFKHLDAATAILFWFSFETIQPISLFELGRWSFVKNKPIYVGVTPEYERQLDVEIQMWLARPELQIVHTLEDLAYQVAKGMDNAFGTGVIEPVNFVAK